MPAVMAAGSAGGTVIVMMSRDSMMMVWTGTWGKQKGRFLKFCKSLSYGLFFYHVPVAKVYQGQAKYVAQRQKQPV